MLILEVWVNEALIDEIYIHNKGKAEHGYHQYQIVKPKGYEEIRLLHKREFGYKSLLKKAFDAMYEKDKPTYRQ